MSWLLGMVVATPAWASAGERDLGVAAQATVLAGRKVAVVIGNGDYRSTTDTRQAVADARTMAAALQDVGFEVHRLIDLDRRAMSRATADLETWLKGAEVGLFYYAGHGIEVGGRNYLVPVDAEVDAERYVDSAAWRVDDVLQAMARAETRLNIVLLDACRNNPFASTWEAQFRATPASGLADMAAPPGPNGFLIGFATSSHRVALDNGLYASVMARNIKRHGFEIRDVFSHVYQEVVRATDGEQVPWLSQAAGPERFCPAGCGAGSEATVGLAAALELAEGVRRELARLDAEKPRRGAASSDQDQAVLAFLGESLATAAARELDGFAVMKGIQEEYDRRLGLALDVLHTQYWTLLSWVRDYHLQSEVGVARKMWAGASGRKRRSGRQKKLTRADVEAALTERLAAKGVADASLPARTRGLAVMALAYLYHRQSIEAGHSNPNIAVRSIERMVQLYDQYQTEYPRSEHVPLVNYYLGWSQWRIGDREAAIETFKRLANLYPDSSLAAESYVLIGEYYFEHDNAYGALRAYLKATAYKDSPKYPFALYKLAWCYYNVGDYGKAIETMKAVVTFSMNQPAEQRNKGLQLQDEALEDLVRFFADAGAMNEAYEYFNKLGKKDLIRSMLKRLAGMYLEQGKFDNAVEAYRRLILENPTSADNPKYQHEIIQCYKEVGDKERTLEEIDRLRRDYGDVSAWARANASDPKTLENAADKIESNLRRVAVDYHNQGRQFEKSRHPDAMKAYQLAMQAYSTYLEEFEGANNEHVSEVHYAYGELLYHKMKDYERSYDQYMRVVEIDPNGKHSRFCAESAIFAAEEQVRKEGGAAADGSVTVDAATKKEPQPLSDWEKRLVDACNQYAKLYPDDKKVRGILYKSAHLLYNKYRFEEAADQFELVILMDPGSRQAEMAANLILDSLARRENWVDLQERARTYYFHPKLGGSSFKSDVQSIYMCASAMAFGLDPDEMTGDGPVADAVHRYCGSGAVLAPMPRNDTASQGADQTGISAVQEAAEIGEVGGDPIILGALDRSLIDEVIKRHMNQIRYCYQRELTKDPSLAGKVVIKFVIAKDGTVSSASIQTTTMNNSAVEQCVVGRFMRMQFPQPRGGRIVIDTYSFEPEPVELAEPAIRFDLPEQWMPTFFPPELSSAWPSRHDG